MDSLFTLEEKSVLKLHPSNFSFVASIYCAIIEFICDNEKKTGSLGTRLLSISEYGLCL